MADDLPIHGPSTKEEAEAEDYCERLDKALAARPWLTPEERLVFAVFDFERVPEDG